MRKIYKFISLIITFFLICFLSVSKLEIVEAKTTNTSAVQNVWYNNILLAPSSRFAWGVEWLIHEDNLMSKNDWYIYDYAKGEIHLTKTQLIAAMLSGDWLLPVSNELGLIDGMYRLVFSLWYEVNEWSKIDDSSFSIHTVSIEAGGWTDAIYNNDGIRWSNTAGAVKQINGYTIEDIEVLNNLALSSTEAGKATYASGYQNGYDSGYYVGYNKAFGLQNEEIRANAYKEGFQDAGEAMFEGGFEGFLTYERIKDFKDNQSYTYGIGYDEGYQDADQGTKQVSLSWILALFSGMALFLNVELFPGLTIAGIVFIPLIISLVFFILKMIRG